MPTTAPLTMKARAFIVALSLVVFAFVINLVRTRKLKEEYALLWLITAVVLVVISLAVDWLDAIAWALGIEYSPALLFTIAFICFLFIFFQFSLSISRFSEQIKVLAQDLALLSKRVQELEEKFGASSTGANCEETDERAN